MAPSCLPTRQANPIFAIVLSTDWVKKFQVQLLYVKDGTAWYEVATPGLDFTLPGFYDVLSLE